jgi:polyhydroxyalkanoate synthesis repressor PhaR
MSDQNNNEPTPAQPSQPPVVVKKYANRRLYNTETSSYITLDTLAELIREGRDFVVYDAKTGDDLTRSVLTQIIVEEEGKGRNLLPTTFLRQLIGFYGDQMQSLVPRFLEQSMTAFAEQQEQIRAAMQKTMGNLFPFGNVAIEEMSRQNLAMVERAMSLFTPFYRPGGAGPKTAGQEPQPAPQIIAELEAEIARLRAENEELRQQLAAKPARKAAGVKQTGEPG